MDEDLRQNKHYPKWRTRVDSDEELVALYKEAMSAILTGEHGPVPYFCLLTEDELLDLTVLRRKQVLTAEEADLLASLYSVLGARYPLVRSAGDRSPEPHPLQDLFEHAGEEVERIRQA
jgi:hypothetical protein